MSVELNESERGAEVGLSRLFSRFFLRELDGDFLAFLRQPGIREVLASQVGEASALLAEWWTEAHWEDAAVEYCRLFVVPGLCPPLASAAGESRPRAKDEEGAIASRVVVLLNAGGLQLPPELAVLPPDHLSVLLEIYAWVLESGDPAGAADFRELFLQSWVHPFAESLVANSNHPIYLAFALLFQQEFSQREEAASE